VHRLALWILSLAACGRAGFERLAPTDSAASSDGAGDAATCVEAAGLLGVWPMEYTDVTGATVLDRSVAARHGTIVGAPLPVVRAGRVGDALDFAGTDAYVSLPALPVAAASGAATTFAMWFFNPKITVDEVLFYAPPAAGPMPPRYDLWLTQTPTKDVALCINAGNGDCWGIVDPGLIGRWVHVTAVFVNGRTDGGALYIDGAPVVMGCRFGTCDQVRTVQAPFTLSGPDLTWSWQGKLDEVRIYDRALSAPEVAELYACAPST